MPVEEAFFRLRNLHKAYRTGAVETTALADVSLDIREGEFVCVMGPSGCGKSTLLNIVALLDEPTGGRYVLGGAEVSAAPESRLAAIRRGNIGFIFQNFLLLDNLSVYENVEPTARGAGNRTLPGDLHGTDAARVLGAGGCPDGHADHRHHRRRAPGVAGDDAEAGRGVAKLAGCQ